VGESNAGWGELEDDGSRELWDTFTELPEPGQHQILDAWVVRKRISIAALVRLGTRINGNVLAFAYPDGCKCRDIETDRRWNELGVEWRSLKIVFAGPKPADTVVIAEGETDAARLTELLPSVDVAVLPAGARGWHSGFAAQLRDYTRILIGTDNDAAGNQGAEAIATTLPQAQRYAPPGEVKDWCAFEGDEPPPFPEAAEGEQIIAGHRRRLLSKLLEEPLHPPDTIVDGLIYEMGLHWLYGPPGGGKTTIAMYASMRAMLAGRPVVWSDFEGGDYVTAMRLQDMEIPLRLAEAGKDIDELFYLLPWPDRVEASLPAIASSVAGSGPAPLFVFDSASKALALQGKDENSNAEVTQWNAQVVRATKTSRLPVIIIDHEAKAGGKGPRGAGAKDADADVVWQISTPDEHRWNRTRAGMVRAVLSGKGDRYGSFNQAHWFEVGDGTGGLTVKPSMEPAVVEASATDGPEI
jgi:AAA domain-containing protein